VSAAAFDQQRLARELRLRAEKLYGTKAEEVRNLATLIATEAHPHELARWLVDVSRISGNGYRPDEDGAVPGATQGRACEDLEGARVDLVERIREGIPEREYVPGCDGWLIRGKRYLAFSPSGVGKSLGTLAVGVEVVRHGGTVAIIDVENGADEYARRLENIVGDDQELLAACSGHLRYYEYPGLSMEWGEGEWVEAVADCDLVVLDSSRNVLSALGLAEDANDDYSHFMARIVIPLSKAGKTTLILDNVGHEGDHPRGASAKRDLNEVLFSLTAPAEFDAQTEGRLIWRRTRQRFAGAIPKALEQRLGGGTYDPPVAVSDHGEEGSAEKFRPTFLMEQVSRLVEYEPGASLTFIEQHVKGKAIHVRHAVQVLVEEGWMRHELGPRDSKQHHSVTPYRKPEDDSDHPVPTPSPTPSLDSSVNTPDPVPATPSPPKGKGRGTGTDTHPVPDHVPTDHVPGADVVEGESTVVWDYRHGPRRLPPASEIEQKAEELGLELCDDEGST
jgi:hypothetical protein